MSHHIEAHLHTDGLPDATTFLSTVVAGAVLFAFLLHRLSEYSSLSLVDTLWNSIVSLIPARLLGVKAMSDDQGSASTTHAAKSQAFRSILGLGQASGPDVFQGLHLNAPRGLGNWDNSCYQNSVLQALSSVPSVASFLKLYDELATLDASDSTTKELSGLIDRLNDVSTSSSYLWTPPRLKSMNSWQQQDAQEYFARISEDVEKEFFKALQQHRKAEGLEALAGMSPVTHKPYQSILTKGLMNAMEGLLAQRVGCTNCGFVEGLSLIPFTSMTLPINDPFSCDVAECLDEFCALESIQGVECAKCSLMQARQDHLDAGEPGPALADGESVSSSIDETSDALDSSNKLLEIINEALSSHDFSDETLAACGIGRDQRVSSTKTRQAVVLRPPQCLVLHFNRSIFDEMSGDLKKNYASISYPQTLDFGRWCLNGGSSKGESATQEEHWTTDPLQSMLPPRFDNRASKDDILYDLCAVVAHFGRHENGHYICFRKMPPQKTEFAKVANFEAGENDLNGDDAADIMPSEEPSWWRISDEKVYAVTELDALAQQGAFMLFYEKRISEIEDLAIIDSGSLVTPLDSGHVSTDREEVAKESPLPT